jgi:hypothetical protein
MPINFPSSPANGATYAYGGKTYRYGGVYWSAVNLADQAQGSVTTPTSFQQAVEGAPWVETLVTSLASAVTANHGGALLDYI